MYGLITTIFCVAMGFAVAGICASGYRLVTNAGLRFDHQQGGQPGARARIVLLVLGGPFVIMRNTIRAARRGARAGGWLVASALIASGWSFCLGVAVINLFAAFGILGV